VDHLSSGGRTLVSAILTAALLAGPATASAQDEEAAAVPGPIVTDRPTDSASPELVPKRTLQFELGYKFTRLDTEGGRTDAHTQPELLTRFGLSEKVEARLTVTGWTIEQTATDTEYGFTDINLGAKFALAEERGRRPQMSLLADVNFPVGAVGFTSDYVIPKLLLLATHTLSDTVGLTWNFGPSVVTRSEDNGAEADLVLSYAVALGAAVGGIFTLFGEAYGNFDVGENVPNSHSLQVGTTVLLGRTWQVDVRGGIGFVDNVPDWLFGAGMAFRLPH
jgi:hypothetical protein